MGVNMLIKAVIVLALLVILYSLGSGLFYLVRGRNQDASHMLKALGWRVGLSLGVFVLLGAGYLLGWITPHAV